MFGLYYQWIGAAHIALNSCDNRIINEPKVVSWKKIEGKLILLGGEWECNPPAPKTE